MSKLQKAYQQFEKLLEEDKIYKNKNICYVDICRRIGISAAELDELLYEELGMKGDEILEKYRSM